MLLSPLWMGPFKLLSCPAPNTYLLDTPAAWRTCPGLNVQLGNASAPYLPRPAHLGAEPPSLPVAGEDSRSEAGCDVSGDTWEPLDKLTNCEEPEAIACSGFEQANGWQLPRFAPQAAPPARAGEPEHSAPIAMSGAAPP